MASFFTVVMRLRQATAHPFLLFKLMRDIFDLEDIKEIRQQFLGIKQGAPGRLFIDQVGRWCERQLEDGKVVGEVTASASQEPFGKGNHGLGFDMDPQLEQLEKSKALGGSICGICDGPFVAPRKTKCGHVFCRDCLESMIEDEEGECVTCPTCGAEHPVDDILAAQGSQRGSQSQSRRRYGKKGRNPNPGLPGNDENGFQPLGDEESAKFLEECDRNINLAMAPSAKTAMVKDIILQWQKKAPDDKIIGEVSPMLVLLVKTGHR